MTPKLSTDVEQLVAATPDGVVRLEGANGSFYYVLNEQAMQLRQDVLKGLQQADQGQVSAWNTAELVEKARALKQAAGPDAES